MRHRKLTCTNRGSSACAPASHRACYNRSARSASCAPSTTRAGRRATLPGPCLRSSGRTYASHTAAVRRRAVVAKNKRRRSSDAAACISCLCLAAAASAGVVYGWMLYSQCSVLLCVLFNVHTCTTTTHTQTLMLMVGVQTRETSPLLPFYTLYIHSTVHTNTATFLYATFYHVCIYVLSATIVSPHKTPSHSSSADGKRDKERGGERQTAKVFRVSVGGYIYLFCAYAICGRSVEEWCFDGGGGDDATTARRVLCVNVR